MSHRAATLPAVTFEPTRWSLVRRAAAPDGDEGSRALQELCASYWPPVYRYFRRVAGDRHRAEDLTQGLFARLLTGESLAQADPERARFRTWLLACAKHHLANERAAARAQKRGGGVAPLPLNFDDEEGRITTEPAADDERPEQAYARRWIAALVDRVLADLEREFERRGRGPVFRAARPFLDPGADPGPMRRAADDAGTSEGAFKVAVHRLRERFHERLRDAIRHTLDREGDLDDELAHLQTLLAAP